MQLTVEQKIADGIRQDKTFKLIDRMASALFSTLAKITQLTK